MDPNYPVEEKKLRTHLGISAPAMRTVRRDYTNAWTKIDNAYWWTVTGMEGLCAAVGAEPLPLIPLTVTKVESLAVQTETKADVIETEASKDETKFDPTVTMYPKSETVPAFPPPAPPADEGVEELSVYSAPHGAEGLHFAMKYLIKAQRPNGAIVNVRVQRPKNFLPNMKFKAKLDPDRVWRLVGNQPRFPGKF